MFNNSKNMSIICILRKKIGFFINFTCNLFEKTSHYNILSTRKVLFMKKDNISNPSAFVTHPPATPFKESVWVWPKIDHFEPIDLSSTGITLRDSRYRIVSPGRDYYVFEYIIAGKGHLFVDGQHFQPGAGDVYILPPHTPHEYYTDPSDPWEKIWFNVSGQLIDSLLEAYHLTGSVYLQQTDLEELFRKGVETVRFYKRTAYTELAGILLEIISRIHLQQGDILTNASSKALHMKNYIDQHWQQPFSLDEMCRISGKSATQTLRIFRRDYGTTPGAYYQQRRFTIAVSYLENTTNSIRDIAGILGFANEFHFSQWFKKQSGVSPANYRRKVRLHE